MSAQMAYRMQYLSAVQYILERCEQVAGSELGKWEGGGRLLVYRRLAFSSSSPLSDEEKVVLRELVDIGAFDEHPGDSESYG